jgi:hypothetical protein
MDKMTFHIPPGDYRWSWEGARSLIDQRVPINNVPYLVTAVKVTSDGGVDITVERIQVNDAG